MWLSRRSLLLLSALLGALLLGVWLLPNRSPAPDEGPPPTANSQPHAVSAAKQERPELPIPTEFQGYSIAGKGQPRFLEEGRYTGLVSIDEESPPDMVGVRDADYIRNNLKLTAEYDREHHYVYCRIANVGERDIVFNEEFVGNFETVTLRCGNESIPRDREGRAMWFGISIGPSVRGNLTLPSRSMYESSKGVSCWLRSGEMKRLSKGSKYVYYEQLSPTPRRGRGIAFCDDLVDFDWSSVNENEVQVVLRQHLANVRPSQTPFSRCDVYEIQSNPISVDVDALKEYKQRLRQHRETVMRQTAAKASDTPVQEGL